MQDSKDMQNFNTPMGRVRGLGSAKSGTGHWIKQRISAIALVPLLLWFACWLSASHDLGLDGLRRAIAEPFNAIALTLLVVTLFSHARLGISVIIEDYVHRPALVILLVLIKDFTAVAFAVTAVFSIWKIAFTAG